MKSIGCEDGWMTSDKAELYKIAHPYLSRDLGSDILHKVYLAEDTPELSNQIDFAGDSLFCEYAYVIDFDKNTFEVFKGFNNDRENKQGRFADIQIEDDSEYGPVLPVKEYSLDSLPSEEEFLSDLTEEEE